MEENNKLFYIISEKNFYTIVYQATGKSNKIAISFFKMGLRANYSSGNFALAYARRANLQIVGTNNKLFWYYAIRKYNYFCCLKQRISALKNASTSNPY